MIIFLYGPDTFRSRQKLNKIIDYYQKIHKSGLNLKFFDGKTRDFREFQNEIKSASMFAEKKLIVLEGVFDDQNFKENFLKNHKEILNSKDIILIYEKKEIPKNDSLFKFLIKKSKNQEFKLLDGQRLKNWIKREVEGYGAKINEEAIQWLIDFVGNDLWQMENEIKKLVSYKNGKEIKKEDAEILVKPKIETDIFQTIDAIASKNKKKAFQLLKEHLKNGDSPLYLFSMINFQFRNLLLLKSLLETGKPFYSLQKNLDLNPFVIRKSYLLAQRFTFSQLKKIYQKIFEIDLDIKTGKIEPETALDLLISEI